MFDSFGSFSRVGLFVIVDNYNIRAFFYKIVYNRSADTAVSAGNQRNLFSSFLYVFPHSQTGRGCMTYSNPGCLF